MPVKSLIALIFVLSWVLPGRYPPWPAFALEASAWLGLLLLALTGLFVKPASVVRIPPAAYPVFLLACVPWLQQAAGLVYFLGDALMASLYLGGCALAIVVGRNAGDDPSFADWLAWILLAGALLSGILATVQWLQLDMLGLWLAKIRPGNHPSANIAQPNNLASLLCLGVGAAIHLREKGAIGRSSLAFFAFFLFCGIAITRSRMAIVAMAVLALWVLWGQRRLAFRCSRMDVAIGFAGFMTLWLAWATISELIGITTDSSLKRLETIGVRTVIWQQMIEAIARQPLFGYGWNQVSVAQLAVAADSPASEYTEYAHNIVLDLLCWNGLPIGGAVVVLAGWWLVSRVRALDVPAAWLGMMIVLVLGTHAMVEYPLAYGYFLVPFGLAIGLASTASTGGDSRGEVGLPRGLLTLAGVVGLGMGAWVFAEYRIVEADYRLMRFESAGLEARTKEHVAPDVVLLTQLREFIRFARTQARQGMSSDELEWMRQVSSRFAYPAAMFRYALALALNGRYAEAETQLLRLRQLHPAVRYDEAVEAWAILGERFPGLKAVRVPPAGGMR